MDVIETSIADVKLITPPRFGGKRGFFSEIYNRRALAEIGVTTEFIQENHAYSADAGTLRGLHFQCPPANQTKLLRVLRGAALDVCVDLRHGSPTFGQRVMAELTAESGQQILCRQGFAHGILTLNPTPRSPTRSMPTVHLSSISAWVRRSRGCDRLTFAR